MDPLGRWCPVSLVHSGTTTPTPPPAIEHHQPPPLLFSMTASLFSSFLQSSFLLSETLSGNTGLTHEPYMPHFRSSEAGSLSSVGLKTFPGKAFCNHPPGSSERSRWVSRDSSQRRVRLWALLSMLGHF